ncbi:MAG: heavy-metal-associated domain-containing protein [Armatimonadota bacterium]
MTYGARSALNAVLSIQAGGQGTVQVAAGIPSLRDARVTLRIEGMYCPGCIGAVTARLTRLRGVTSADVWMGGALVRYDPTLVGPDRIREAATFYRFEARIDSDSIGVPPDR